MKEDLDLALALKNNQLQESDTKLAFNPAGIYDAQKHLGQVIANKVHAIAGDFDSIGFRVLLPPRVSLHDQTWRRFQAAFRRDFETTGYVIKASQGNNEAWTEFLEEAALNPTRLYVVLQDEAHWGINKEGVLDKMLHAERNLMDSMRTSAVQLENIAWVCVSATPWAITLPSWVKPEHIIDWDKELLNVNTGYKGREQLVGDNSIRDSPQFETILNSFQADEEIRCVCMRAKEGSLAELALMLDYVIALRQAFGVPPVNWVVSQETATAVMHLRQRDNNGFGNMVAVRFSSVSSATMFRAAIWQTLAHFRQPECFQTMLHNEEVNAQLSGPARDTWREKRKLGDVPCSREPQNAGDLVGVPCLMLLVETGRMGDTFPSTMRVFDLRARYRSDWNYSTLTQDIGRVFGYGDRPIGFVSPDVLDDLYEGLRTTKRGPKADEYLLLSPRGHQEVKRQEEAKRQAAQQPAPQAPAGQPLVGAPDDFQPDHWIESKEHMVHGNRRRYPEVKERTFVFMAKPQSGKTGAMIWALHLLKALLPPLAGTPSMAKLVRMFRGETAQSVRDLVNFVATVDGRKHWDTFHRLLGEHADALRRWATDKDPQSNKNSTNVLPVARAKRMVVEVVTALTQPVISVADCGCGTGELGRFLRQKYPAAGKTVNIQSIDVAKHPAYDDAKSGPFVQGNYVDVVARGGPYDIIVICMALWGKSDEYRDILAAVIARLGPGGHLIVIEPGVLTAPTRIQGIQQALSVAGTVTRSDFARGYAAILLSRGNQVLMDTSDM